MIIASRSASRLLIPNSSLTVMIILTLTAFALTEKKPAALGGFQHEQPWCIFAQALPRLREAVKPWFILWSRPRP